ncbi:Protein of unknown function [Bacillus thuringiensis]|nr:Protein of unknown function [Bacillus thuringiensis]
MQKKEIM